MTTVAETYLRVDEFRPNEDNVMHVAEVVGRATHIIALELYPETAEVEIRLEPGSLKVWARVTAAAGPCGHIDR